MLMHEKPQVTTSSPRSSATWVSGVLVVVLFVLATWFAGRYAVELKALAIHDGNASMLAYVLVTTLAVVIAPVSVVPLIPIASAIWGWMATAILSIIGWVIGAQIAFFLARWYGRGLLAKFVSLEKIGELESRIPKQHLFWTVVFLRMTLPVDVLSYALGLFSTMKSRSYFFATLIGVTPFAFIFAYAGVLSLQHELIIVTFGCIVVFLANKAQLWRR